MKPAKSDLDFLQGSWSLEALEVDGANMSPEMLAEARIEVKGNHFQSLNMGAVYEGAIAVDSAANPKTFDLTFTKGPEKGNTNRGIYEIQDGGWRLCLATRGDARPKKFATKAGTGHALQTLRHAAAASEAKAAKAPTPAKSGAPTELEGEWSLVSGWMNGKPMDDVMIHYGVRAFQGNRTTLKFGPQTYIDAVFTLNGSQIDYEHTKGMFAGKSQLGIYECDGKTLKLSTAPPGSPRPTNFEMQGANTISVFRKR